VTKALTQKKAKKKALPSIDISEEEEEERLEEEGFIQDADPMPMVLDRLTGKDVELRIVKSAEMLKFTNMEDSTPSDENATCQVARAFGTTAWASSVLALPPQGKTAVAMSENQLRTCVVLSGKVKVSVHRSSFILHMGGMFYIPAGNVFSIENVSYSRHARLAISEFSLFENES